MVSPQAKRAAVETLMTERSLEVTRACGWWGFRARCIAIAVGVRTAPRYDRVSRRLPRSSVATGRNSAGVRGLSAWVHRRLDPPFDDEIAPVKWQFMRDIIP